MPSPNANNVASTDVYQEVIFTVPRPGFTVTVNNKAILYQCAYPGATGWSGDAVWESLEHTLIPSSASFNDPAKEGYPGATMFSGFRFKSAAVGIPAIVTVS